MQSAIGKLKTGDFWKGLVLVVLVIVWDFLGQVLKTHGFDITLSDFSPIVRPIQDAILGYLTKQLFSDSEGKVLGVIG